MTFQQSSTIFAYDDADPLYPVVAGADNLGSVLLVNTLIRAAAAVGVGHIWPSWTQDIVSEEKFPVAQLLSPETQRGCTLLCGLLTGRTIPVKHAYRRAFLQELSTSFEKYDGFFVTHGVAEATRMRLFSMCEHENLILGLENELRQRRSAH